MSALKTHPQNDTTRVGLLVKITMAYVNNNVDSAVGFANEALSISQKIAYEKGESLSLQTLGIISINKNEYDKALSYYNKALEITQKNGNSIGISVIYCHIGDIYARSSKHNEAIEFYKKALA